MVPMRTTPTSRVPTEEGDCRDRATAGETSPSSIFGKQEKSIVINLVTGILLIYSALAQHIHLKKMKQSISRWQRRIKETERGGERNR